MDEDFPPIDDRDALHRLPPAVLEKASRPGRIRGIALETWTEARRDPARAGRALREGVRQARALHSRERRLVREGFCLLYTSPSPRDGLLSRMPSSA